jgi:hypothetical protein
MRRVQIIGALCLAAVAYLLGAVNASAAPSDPFQYKLSFPLPGVENPSQIAVNEQTGNLLVYSNGTIGQFDPAGNPVDFPAIGTPTISTGVPEMTMTVDNTGGPTQGNIYLFNPRASGGFGDENLWSYAADGSPLGGTTPHNLLAGGGTLAHALGILPDGTVLIVGLDLGPLTTRVNRVDPIGQLLAPNEPFVSPNGDPTWGAIGGFFDRLGNFYGSSEEGELRSDASDNYDLALSGPTGLPTVLNTQGLSFAFEPSTNDLYGRTSEHKIIGVHYTKPRVPGTPFLVLEGFEGGGPFVFDGTGQTLYLVEPGRVSAFHREPLSPPIVHSEGVSAIRAQRAALQAGMSGRGANTTYRFEYGTDTSYGSSTVERSAARSYFPVEGSATAEGLRPNTTYHFRLAVTNPAGTSYGPDLTFKTYPTPSDGTDSCPNALARKQTLAERLPDCRAYELVSAADTGGYDVESYLAPGQSPFPGFPLAGDRVLYATHAGAIPGPWNATNKGPDPYLATRGPSGWGTAYEGLPADLNPAAGIFSSVLGEADSSLSTLAFAGANLCSPCFSSGLQTGIPVRLPSGQLAQGMAGSLSGSVDPSAKPEGKVARYFSGDGKKLLFASKYAFEPGANDNNGSLTVYERNLAAGTTEIVSTDPSGNALTGEGISELDVSNDGSRVLVGKKLGADPQGNESVHPYLHIAGRPGSIDLAPTTTTGVLYAGMTSDGSKVLFTSADKLTGEDTDNSADLYEADFDGSGNLALKAITAANDSDACAPINCSAVPIAGGGGVASSTGAVYFLSPEQFGGQGTPNQPNLYLAQPSGSITLVATLEPNNPLVLDSLLANGTRKPGDFQTTPSGNYAAFTSGLPLTGVGNFGFRNVFEFAAAGQLSCPSCDTSGTTDGSLADDVELAPNGLSLLADGRVFFTTRFPLLLNDTNGRKDVYEWSDGRRQLISSGTGPFDSALLSASANGTDVFFFTQDKLASEEDRNGQQMKIYDAREGGGFFKLPASVQCQAADECHGPGTPAPAPAAIRSSGKTTRGNVVVCAKNRVKKRGHCVKKKHAKKKHGKKKHGKKRKGAAKNRAAATNGKRGGRDA